MYWGARAAVRIGLTARCRSIAKEPDDPRASQSLSQKWTLGVLPDLGSYDI